MMELINEAIGLYKELLVIEEAAHEKQMRIAQIAIELCKIQKGNFRGKAYTLSHFAKDTGIPRVSISKWVDTTKRIVPIVPIESVKDWNHAKYISAQLPRKDNPTDEQIIAAFKVKPKGTVFDKYLRSFEKFTYLLDDTDLNRVNSDTLKAIMVELDLASDIINEHLTEKRQSLALTIPINQSRNSTDNYKS